MTGKASTKNDNRSVGTVPMRWHGDSLELLDQRLLPGEEHWITVEGAAGVAQCIRDMVVRGAPAIGITAAYGVALAARHCGSEDWQATIRRDMELLAASRPTAVNLFWALERMGQVLSACQSLHQARETLANEAVTIHREDVEANRRMADYALEVIGADKPVGVLTHCNTGALATGGYGTALGVIRRLHEEKCLRRVYADETRPWLQGSRLTAWELAQEGIPVTLNTDGAAATLMASGKVGWVIVGADRITANGDVANKIGTYSLAVLARHHGVRFMVAAPSSTVDMALQNGADIPIEEREAEELREFRGIQIAPPKVDVFNPVFDVTSASLIDAIVTERGAVHNPNITGMRSLFA